jgi:osmotically-inducible protein OsmY
MTLRSDGEIQAAVFGELAWDARVTATSIGVAVHHGIVTLTGTVRTHVERFAAQEVTRHPFGVLAVANEIEVGSPPSDLSTDAERHQAARLVREMNLF